MATADTQILFNGLARRLVKDGLISHDEATTVQLNAQKENLAFVSYMVNHNILSSQEIAAIASEEFGVPLFDIDAMNMDVSASKLVSEKLVRQHNALPLFQRGNNLFVAISDPTNLRALDEFQFNTGNSTHPILVDEQSLSVAIDKSMDENNQPLAGLEDGELDDLDLSADAPADSNDNIDPAVDDTPVVRFINKIILDAIKAGASDIHFEPYEKKYRVRTRIDGILHETATAPTALSARIVARLKVLSRLNIAERRIPQDGRMRMNLSKNKAIDFRVNTCPILNGEKVVLRILDPTSAQIGIESLGFEEDQKQIFLEAMHQPYGMILVTGPTGSGKTVSLYTALNILNTEDRNISTAEDPAEIGLPGVNQVNVHPQIGLDFATCLRSFLRQDPDIIMVGEIRDLETAEIAIKAAQTGHMVFSTLHTNDAPKSLTRLVNMGVPTYNIATSVSLIIAQRLARKLCQLCKTPDPVPAETLLAEGFSQKQIDNGLIIYKAVGCEKCTQGYKGRTGIYQVMPVSDVMGRLILEGCNDMQLAEQAEKEGVDTLKQSGLKKIANGLTSLEEINRIIEE